MHPVFSDKTICFQYCETDICLIFPIFQSSFNSEEADNIVKEVMFTLLNIKYTFITLLSGF